MGASFSSSTPCCASGCADYRPSAAIRGGIPVIFPQFASEGATVVKKSPTEFGAFMMSEMNKWEQVVKKGGIKAE